MKSTIIAKDKIHLKNLIKQEIKAYGNNADLNHIDISNVDDLSSLFVGSEFNGNISQWNTSNVISMYSMFANSQFNGDISLWDVSKVEHMSSMFHYSSFNNDISRWDVSNVQNMDYMFYGSCFNKDISAWNISKVTDMEAMFAKCAFNQDLLKWKPYIADISFIFDKNSHINIPYWAHYDDTKERKVAIDAYLLQQKLYNELNNNNNHFPQHKI